MLDQTHSTAAIQGASFTTMMAMPYSEAMHYTIPHLPSHLPSSHPHPRYQQPTSTTDTSRYAAPVSTASVSGQSNTLMTQMPRFVYLRPSSLSNGGMGVWAQDTIPAGTRFGPYTGNNVNSIGYAWRQSPLLLGQNPSTPADHWMGFVNRARNRAEQNLVAFQLGNRIFYEVTCDIPRERELLVWYDNDLAKALGIHTMEEIQPEDDGAYVCKTCQRAFFYPYSLIWHRMHQCAVPHNGSTGSDMLWCDHCGKVFALSLSLRMHIREHSQETTPDTSQSYKCYTCNQTFGNSSDLLTHMTTHGMTSQNNNEKSLHCDQCDKTFTHCTQLTAHARQHVGGPKNHRRIQCDQCGKKFSTPWTLKEHMRTHTGDKPFKCNHCGKAFAHHSNMIRHTRTHTGERPFKCGFCGKAFSVHSNLTAHIPTHTGVKQFKCTKCEKAFVHASSLHKHMKTHIAKANGTSSPSLQSKPSWKSEPLDSLVANWKDQLPMWPKSGDLLPAWKTEEGDVNTTCDSPSSSLTSALSPHNLGHMQSMSLNSQPLTATLNWKTGPGPLPVQNR